MNTHTPDSRHDRAPCARLTRRQALRRGFLGATGLLLSDRLAHAAPPVPLKAKAKSVIQVFLWGGMSHTDTWDPKMDAGYDYTGQFKDEIATSVSGIKMGSLFPQLAKQADKYSIIRSMTHRNNGHETAAYLMQTGHLPGERLAYPCIGAIFALLKGYNAGYKGLIPPYVVLTQPQGRFSEAGFLGSRCKPFATGGDPNAAHKARLGKAALRLGQHHVRRYQPLVAGLVALDQGEDRADAGIGQALARRVAGLH